MNKIMGKKNLFSIVIAFLIALIFVGYRGILFLILEYIASKVSFISVNILNFFTTYFIIKFLSFIIPFLFGIALLRESIHDFFSNVKGEKVKITTIILYAVLDTLFSFSFVFILINLIPSSSSGYGDLYEMKSFWEALVMTGIFGPITEEIIYRGIIFRGLRGRYKQGTALIISALIFAIFHGSPAQIINSFFAGIILGFVFVKTGSLIIPISMHCINNIVFTFLDSISTLFPHCGPIIINFTYEIPVWIHIIISSLSIVLLLIVINNTGKTKAVS
ncbi:MAG: CPBP family intramembrane metalloprotease [Halanaerobiaceae bacterium]|nr:CPBP family intramembrane metalloprotease [Halanaerobiaceae bacterium]